MTNYNDGKWHGWNGGACPVHPETVVEVVWNGRSGPVKKDTGAADRFAWSHIGATDIIAFRIIKEHKEPREVWMMWWDSEGYWLDCDPNTKGSVLFREVLE